MFGELWYGLVHLCRTGHHLNIRLTSAIVCTARHLHYSSPGLFMVLLTLPFLLVTLIRIFIILNMSLNVCAVFLLKIKESMILLSLR